MPGIDTAPAWKSVYPRVYNELCSKYSGDLENKMYLMKVSWDYIYILSLLEVTMIQTLPTFLIQGSKSLYKLLLKSTADFSLISLSAQPGSFRSRCVSENSGYSLTNPLLWCCQTAFCPVPNPKTSIGVPYTNLTGRVWSTKQWSDSPIITQSSVAELEDKPGAQLPI